MFLYFFCLFWHQFDFCWIVLGFLRLFVLKLSGLKGGLVLAGFGCKGKDEGKTYHDLAFFTSVCSF